MSHRHKDRTTRTIFIWHSKKISFRVIKQSLGAGEAVARKGEETKN